MTKLTLHGLANDLLMKPSTGELKMEVEYWNFVTFNYLQTLVSQTLPFHLNGLLLLF